MNLTKAKFNNISHIAKENDVVSALIFGQNSGLILELSNEVFFDFKYDLKEIFTEEEILQSQEKLQSAICVDDFFAEKKLIKIYNITSKFFNIFEKIYPILKQKKDKVKLCLIGDEIAAKIKLRTFFEENEDLISVCCYFDEKEDAKDYTLNFFAKNNIKFEKNLPEFIAQNLHGDRRILKNELEKIHLSFLNEKEKVVSIEDLKEVLEDQTIDNVFDFIDSFGMKNKKEALSIFKKILDSEEITFIGLLHLLYRHFQNLFEICFRIENKKSNVEKELFAFFFKRKPFIKKQIEIWNTNSLKEMLKFISSIEQKTIYIGENISIQLLINQIVKF